MELFGGKFHNNLSTLLSWAILPVFAGAAIQTNSISLEAIILSGIAAVITYILITTSRKYKNLIIEDGNSSEIRKKELILKMITISVITATVVFVILRFYF